MKIKPELILDFWTYFKNFHIDWELKISNCFQHAIGCNIEVLISCSGYIKSLYQFQELIKLAYDKISFPPILTRSD